MQRMGWTITASRLLVGLLIMGFGVVMTLDWLGMVAVGPVQNLWPLAVLAAGLLFFTDAQGRGGSVTGAWLVALGMWLVMNQVVGSLIGRYVGPLGAMIREAWPVLFVLAGFGMMLHTLIDLVANRRVPSRTRLYGSASPRLEPIGFLSNISGNGRHGR